MSFVQDEHIPSGVYAIRNYRTMNVVATRSRDKDLLGSIPSAERSWKWNLTRRSNNKYTVQNAIDQFYAQCAPTPEAGKTVFVQSQVFEWNIKQVSEVTARDCYWIYSSKNDRLVWSLPDGEDGTPVVFAVERNNPRFWWRFERIEDASSGQEATARLDYLPDYIRAVGLIDMARDLMARSQYLEALKGCDEAVRLHRDVIAKHPDLCSSNMDLAFSLQILADCLCRLGMLDKASDVIEDAIHVYQTQTVSYHEESSITDATKIKEKITDRIAQQSSKTDQQAILRMVEDIQSQLTNINLTKDETPVEFNAEAPPPPEIFFGRDEYVANVVDMILKKMPARLAILGPGGVGKTAVASAVYHHEQIEAFFQDHRFFITCEAMFSAESLLETLWVVFGLDVKKQKSLKVLGDSIKAGPYTLLILDNFETLWDVMIDKMEIQKLFGMLTSNIMKKLTVLITMRGTMRPANIVWTRPFLEPLPVLSVEAAKDLYLAVADSNEEGLDALLETVDCLPLAVNLLANLSQQGYSPLELLDMWNKERTHLLNIGGNDKSENIEVSIALSINSPLMSNNEEALILLKVIAYLPGGLQIQYLQQLAGNIAKPTEAQTLLFRTSLAYCDKSRNVLKTLSPIRFFVLDNYPMEMQDEATVDNFYFAMCRNSANLNPSETSRFKLVVKNLTDEKVNVVYILERSLQGGTRSAQILVQAVIDFSEFLYWSTPSERILNLAAPYAENLENLKTKASYYFMNGEITSKLENYEDAKIFYMKAYDQFQMINYKQKMIQCLQSIGSIQHMLGNNTKAKETFSDIRTQFIEIEYKLGAAQCLLVLGDISRVELNLTEAEQMFHQAKTEFQQIDDKMGVSQSLNILGDITYRMGKYTEAEKILKEAYIYLQEVGEKLTTAQCLQCLGEVQWKLQNYSEAQKYLNDARSIFLEIEQKSDAAICLCILGFAANSSGNMTDAKQFFQRADIEFDQLHSSRISIYAGNCLKGIGDIEYKLGNFAEAKLSYEKAKLKYKKMGHKGGAMCLKTLGRDQAALGNFSDAESTIKEAVTQFQAIDEKNGVAECIYILGDISRMSGNGLEAKKTVSEAMTLFQNLGNENEVASCIRNLGNIEQMLGNHDTAKERFFDSKEKFQKLNNKFEVAQCSHSLGNTEIVLGNYSIATALLEEALDIFEKESYIMGTAQCLMSLGDIHCQCGDYIKAEEALVKASKDFQDLGSKLPLAECLLSLGNVALKQEKWTEAKQMFQNTLEQFQSIGSQLGIGQSLQCLGEVAQSVQDYPEANKKYHEARNLLLNLGNKVEAAGCIGHLGEIELAQENYSAAADAFKLAASEYENIAGAPVNAAICLMKFGICAGKLGNHGEAGKAVEEARGVFEAYGYKKEVGECVEILAEYVTKQ